MMSDSCRAWRRCGPPATRARGFDPAPIFDPGTGQTLFLNDLPALLLEAVDATPKSMTTLLADLAGAVELDDEAAVLVSAALIQLEQAELVESLAASR